MNGYYDYTVASKYDKLRTWHDPVPTRLADIAHIDASSRVIDLACGTGNLTQAIQQTHACRFIGIDLSFDMIRIAHGKIQDAVFVLGDCSEMPFPDGYFTSAVGSFFIHHVHEKRRQSLFRECYRILSGGAFALVTVSHAQIEKGAYNRFFPEIAVIDKARCPDTPEILRWFRAAGFVNVGSEIILDVPGRIDKDFLFRAQHKVISTLDMISPSSFEKGISAIQDYIEMTDEKAPPYDRPFTIVFGEKVGTKPA